MICKVCHHCGLCEGSLENKELSVSSEFNLKKKITGDISLPYNQIGIAFDIGTTSIAAALYSLKDGILLSSIGEANRQISFGSDVVSRISYSVSDDGLRKLHDSIVSQIEDICRRMILTAQNFFIEKRRGRAVLSRIVISGNTAMESFVLGVTAASLSSFPFRLPDKFGMSVCARKIFTPDFIFPDCEVYFVPAIESFVGGDTVSAMISCGFLENEESAFLADIGTNCELCVYDSVSKRIFCTSTSAGPAFEGYGLDCGIPAQEGAVARVSVTEKGKICCSVIGGGKASGICGTGILSAVSSFYKNGIIDYTGTFTSCHDRVNLSDDVYITQQDIRNFQLAKSAVETGLEILSEKSGCKTGHLYLAGGFGSILDINDACTVNMIPDFLCASSSSVGNASLYGASLLLLDTSLRKCAEIISTSSVHIDLAQEQSFQNIYIKNLNLK